MGIDYLFIRILEACNSRCCMCRMAGSNDKYRLSVCDFKKILDAAKNDGVKNIRFTGGEPLIHKSIELFVSMITEKGLKSSIITNGLLLSKKISDLAECGLNQIIVSIDGPPNIHDKIRGVEGLYKKAVAGLDAAVKLGIHTRVNTVCGPNNYKYMPELQDILTKIGVKQWELSSLKLGGPLEYTSNDIQLIESINKKIYVEAKYENKLIPMGKRWCGESEVEKQLYYAKGVTPRPNNICHIVDRVRYLNALDNSLYVCSLLPHRTNLQAAQFSYDSGTLESASIKEQADHFRICGSSVCTGCSTTAAGCFSNMENKSSTGEWYY